MPVVADWNVMDFLISGQSEEVSLTELKRLEGTKAIGMGVRVFAHKLRLFYSVRQNLVTDKNEAELLNRDALKGFEYHVIQNKLQADFHGYFGQPSSDRDVSLPVKTSRSDTNPAVTPHVKSSILSTARQSEPNSQPKPKGPQLRRPAASTTFPPRDIASKQVNSVDDDEMMTLKLRHGIGDHN
ncbi:hypothetical protein BGZ79_001461 [Entomortierella chlamydospora]|nr:hypothetical protein BGZ79_001461 [Entomortierella chlamydospora]